jgi:hypothetical protein
MGVTDIQASWWHLRKTPFIFFKIRKVGQVSLLLFKAQNVSFIYKLG